MLDAQNVSRTVSVSQSIRSSLNVLEIGSLLYSDILYDDSEPWYIVIDQSRFLKKIKNRWPKLEPNLDHTFSSQLHTMIACYSV